MSAPVFAYYYMWMQGNYWQTDKLDHPLQPFPGNYNSDNPLVISYQIDLAMASGIDGFICSWKNTAAYQKILPLVMAIAGDVGFTLAIEYETMLTGKSPQPITSVITDLQYFVKTYAQTPVWHLVNHKPMIIIDDTNYYTSAQIAALAAAVPSLSILADVPTAAIYNEYARHVAGNAYYWSSQGVVAPAVATDDMTTLAKAVHDSKGIWIPSFSPGFNATLIGGKEVVARDNGATLKTEYANALASDPDIMGLISWNEWTENTYVEPGELYGTTALDTLKELVS